MKEFIQIIANPVGLYKEANTINWVRVLLILVLLTIINSLLSLQIGEVVLKNSEIFTKMPSEQAEMIKATQQKLKYFGVVTSSIVFITKMFFYSLILWGGVSIFRKGINFSRILSVLLISYFIIVLGDLVNVGANYLVGIENITSQYDAYKIGINSFFSVKDIGGPIYTALFFINPFQIWFIILLVLGLKTIAEIDKSRAILVTLIFWFITVLIPVIMAYMSEIAMSKAGAM